MFETIQRPEQTYIPCDTLNFRDLARIKDRVPDTAKGSTDVEGQDKLPEGTGERLQRGHGSVKLHLGLESNRLASQRHWSLYLRLAVSRTLISPRFL